METVITIDGPAGSGKSTASRLLASKINYLYLDTGAMYRAVALAAKRRGIDFEDAEALGALCNSLNIHFKTSQGPPKIYLDNEDINKLSH